MNEKELQKKVRDEVKKMGGKVVFSRKILQITLNPSEQRGMAYSSTANIDEETKTLIITSFLTKRNISCFASLTHIIDYWVEFAKVKRLEKIKIQRDIFVPKDHYSFSKKINEDRFGFLTAEGFVQDEVKYELLLSSYVNLSSIHQKIHRKFLEKKEELPAMVFTKANTVEEKGIFKGEIEWKGHKAHIDVYYDKEKQQLILKDTKKIQMIKKENEVDELINEYMKKIEQLRKIKNIYEPPTDNLRRVLSNTLRMYKADAKLVMNELLEYGYKNEEIEKKAFDIYHNSIEFTQSVQRIGFFSQEALFKFFDHYVLLFIEGQQSYSKVFENKEEMFTHYQKQVSQMLQQRIEEKKKKIQ
jgi:hypothetical protein